MSEGKKVVIDNPCEIIIIQYGETDYNVDLLIFYDINVLRSIAEGIIEKDPNGSKFKIYQYDRESLIDLIRILHNGIPISDSLIDKYNKYDMGERSICVIFTLMLLAIFSCIMIIVFVIGMYIGLHNI